MSLMPWKVRPAVPAERNAISPVSRARFEMDQLFDRMLQDPFGMWGDGQQKSMFNAALDVEDSATGLTVKVDLPGVDAKAVELSVHNGMLTISGERKSEEQSEGEGWRHVERRFGSFQRGLQLPEDVDPDSVEAQHDNGVLTVRFKKQPAAQAKKIQIRSGK